MPITVPLHIPVILTTKEPKKKSPKAKSNYQVQAEYLYQQTFFSEHHEIIAR